MGPIDVSTWVFYPTLGERDYTIATEKEKDSSSQIFAFSRRKQRGNPV